jgi:hypothetical protein
MNRQVYIKCDQIARMIVKGMPKTRIALEMGMSYDGLVRITREPEYLKIEEDVRNVVVGKMDARLARRAEMNDDVEEAVPEAMKVLLDAVTKKRDLRAALEVLDRDPQRQFAKAKTVTLGPNGVGVTGGLASDALASAVKDADLTHTILKNSPPPMSPQTTMDSGPIPGQRPKSEAEA